MLTDDLDVNSSHRSGSALRAPLRRGRRAASTSPRPTTSCACSRRSRAPATCASRCPTRTARAAAVRPATAAQPEDLILLVDAATASSAEGAAAHDRRGARPTPRPTTRTGIWAKLDISLWVGDDVVAPATTDIVAGGTIYIHGDANRLAAAVDPTRPRPARHAVAGNADTDDSRPGRLRHDDDLRRPPRRRLRPRRRERPHRPTLVFGHVDVDHFTFDGTLLGARTHVYGSQNLSATDQTAVPAGRAGRLRRRRGRLPRRSTCGPPTIPRRTR